MRRAVTLLPFVCASFLTLACRNTAHTSATTTGSGGSSSHSATASTGANMAGTGTGGMACMMGPEHAIHEVTNGSLGSGTAVTLKGVVAMSKKFLVSSKTSCLWGVFVSEPGLTETAPNTGILALSYGTPPVVPPGGTKAYCPEQANMPPTPAGDAFPDDVKPGDVLDISGVTASFPTMFNCMAPDPANSVPMRQLSQVCAVTRTSTGAALPKAHLLSGADAMKLFSTTDSTFHDTWGGVKVRVENAAVVPGTMAADCPMGVTPPCVVRNYGAIQVAPGITFGDKMYYRGYQKTQVCHAGPLFANTSTTFASIEGFHYLDFCTWGLQVADKCADLNPGSDDCAAAMPPVTSCASVP